MKPRQALSPSSRQGGEAMDGPRSCCKGTINSPMNQLFAHLFCLCHGFVAQFLHTLCKVRLSDQSALGRRLALAESGANLNGSPKTDNPNNPYKDEAPGESLVGETRFWTQFVFVRVVWVVYVGAVCVVGLYELFDPYAFGPYALLRSYALLDRRLCWSRLFASPRSLFCHRQATLAVSGVLALPLSLDFLMP